MRVAVLAGSLFLVASCSADIGLTVDLRTDYAPGAEFATARTEVSASPFTVPTPTGAVQSAAARAGTRYVDGVRIAEVTPIMRGNAYVRVTLLDSTGAKVAQRVTEVTITSTYALTVVLSRSCDSVVCPPAGGDATLTACNAGMCVDPRCAPGHPELCGMSGCASDADCAGSGACGVGRCASGVCLVDASSARCIGGRVCTTDFRCVDAAIDAGPAPDLGGHDLGPPDAGPPPCGADGQPCCASRSCAAGTSCIDTSSGPMCVCGGQNQVCCAGRTCDSATDLLCQDTTFGPLCLCGGRFQRCCAGRTCDSATDLLCQDTMYGPICLCGGRNQRCCAGRACDQGLCNDTIYGPICQCGGRNQQCCLPERLCDDGSSCEDTAFGPLCLCGTAGHLCCSGTVCDDGTTCTGTAFGPICM